jgi:hypothetical protein
VGTGDEPRRSNRRVSHQVACQYDKDLVDETMYRGRAQVQPMHRCGGSPLEATLRSILTLQETAKSMRAKTFIDKDQALVDKLSMRVSALVDKTS